LGQLGKLRLWASASSTRSGAYGARRLDRHGKRFIGRTTCAEALPRASPGSPTCTTETTTIFACGTRAASEWTISGTTVDGERIDVRGCDLWTFADNGKLVRKDSFWKIRDPS
jgi:taurine dehydrogenase small subunit